MKILLTEKTIKTIFNIDKSKNIHKLSRLTDMTYAHQVKIVNDLELKGIVSSKRIGRIRKVNLTDKGNKLKWHLEQIKLL